MRSLRYKNGVFRCIINTDCFMHKSHRNPNPVDTTHCDRSWNDGADLGGYVLSPAAIAQSRLPDVGAEKALYSRHAADPDILHEPQETLPQVLTLPGEAVYSLAPEAPIRAMPTRPEAFFEMLGVSEQWPSA